MLKLQCRRFYLSLLGVLCVTCNAQIQAAGDTMLGVQDGAKLLAPAREILSDARHISLVNLEGVISDVPRVPKCRSGEGCYTFRMPSQSARVLAQHGVRVVNLANNHSMDFGAGGLGDTLSALVQEKIAPIGLVGAYSAAVVVHEAREYAFIGASPHAQTLSVFDMALLESMIRSHKAHGRIVVFTAHLGAEGASAYRALDKQEYFMGARRGNPVAIAHQVIDAGADVFVGHGPHVLRPLELYKGRLIAYSLGNFLTHGAFSLSGVMAWGGILRIEVQSNGQFTSGRFFGFEQTKSTQRDAWERGEALKRSPRADDFLKTITREHSHGLQWNSDGTFTAAALLQPNAPNKSNQ